MEPGPAASPGPSRSFKEELLCAVCYDPFRDAVTLHCGHNFCRGCVSRCWEVQVTPTCPVCKDRASPADLRTNHTLNNLVEKLLREEAEGARWAGQRSSRHCRLHRGQLSLFCLEDKELLCCSCQADSRHQGHRVQPVKDTAHDFRVRATGPSAHTWVAEPELDTATRTLPSLQPVRATVLLLFLALACGWRVRIPTSSTWLPPTGAAFTLANAALSPPDERKENVNRE